MRQGLKIAALILAISGCSRDKDVDEQAPAPNDRTAELKATYDAKLSEAASLRDPANGWITPDDCDGALWSGKYGAASGVEPIDWTAAEYPDEPGRFARRPLAKPCASQDGTEDSGAPTTWSRDMGTGLLAYAWRKKDRALLERHIAYGVANNWKMGKPTGDGRTIYSPSFIGRVYQAELALGGEDNVNRYWPDLYPKGLVDYQAHLQVMSIWQRGEVSAALAGPEVVKPDVDEPSTPSAQALLGINGTMLEALKEHAERDPRDPLFQAVYGRYTGDMKPAVEACLAPDGYVGEYVRCGTEPRRCELAAWLFACDIVLRAFGLQ